MKIVFKENGVELGKKWNKLRNEILNEINKLYVQIEETFGPIDKTYSLTTINFTPNAPATEVDERNKTITIRLPVYVMQDNTDAIYQRKLNLSHELVHTITPCADYSKVTFLEQGLATVLSEQYTGCNSNPPPNYCVAKKLVSDLLEIDNKIIKTLRKKYPDKKISDYTIQDIMGEMSPSNLNLVQDLTKPF